MTKRMAAMGASQGGWLRALWLGAALCSVACGSGSSNPNQTADSQNETGDPQTPPMGRASIERWLAQGFYQSWRCEPQPHPARPFGAHGETRICSNDLLSAAQGGEFPVGSASVKEIHSGSQISGYAVSVHNFAGTSGGTWYWYERVGSGTTEGQGAAVCVDCHRRAGADSEHSGHDFVYTQVR